MTAPTLTEYIAQPPVTGESSFELKPFLDDEIFFSKPETADWQGYVMSTGEDILNWGMGASRVGGQTMLVFRTDRADPRLGEDFAGIPMHEALRACFSYPGVEGVVLVNKTRHWKSFLIENFTGILAD